MTFPTFPRCTVGSGHYRTMRIFLTANLATVAFSFNHVTISPLSVQSARSTLGATKTRCRPGQGTSNRNNHDTMVMSAELDQSEGPFTRKSLLEGVTKASGVLGAGTLVQRGLFAGVTYHGKPDLSEKVWAFRNMKHAPGSPARRTRYSNDKGSVCSTRVSIEYMQR